MTTRQAIDQLLHELLDEQLNEVLEFARYVIWREQREAWQQFGRAQLAKAYLADEPEYTLADAVRLQTPAVPRAWVRVFAALNPRQLT